MVAVCALSIFAREAVGLAHGPPKIKALSGVTKQLVVKPVSLSVRALYFFGPVAGDGINLNSENDKSTPLFVKKGSLK